MDRPLRFVKRLGAIYRVLLETPAGCWLTDCNGPSPPFFEVSLDRYERVPAPNSWMDEHTITPAQEVRLRMIQPMMDCDDCISDKTLRYKMAAEAAQQHQTTTRRILRLYYRYLATGRLTQKRTQQASKSNQMIERAIRRYYFGAKRLSLWPYQYTVQMAELTTSIGNKLYDCSGGIPAYIIKIFGESQAQALIQGRSCIDEKIIQRAVELLAIKVPRTYAAGTHISDFEIGMDPPAPPLEQEEVPRQYAVKRGRKAAQRDDGDLLVAYNNGVDIEAHLSENGYLEVDYHG